MTNASIELFENNTEAYEEWFETHNVLYEDELATLKNVIGAATNGLEIGSGTGRFSTIPNIIQGVEPSENMGKIAKQKGLNVIKGVAESLPFGAKSFDFAVMMTTICFLKKPEIALQEAFRVIRDRGFLIVGFIDKSTDMGEMYLRKKEESRFYKEAIFYTFEEIALMVEKVGFSNAEKFPCSLPDNPIVFLKAFKG